MNDLVLADPNALRGKWKTGRTVQVFQGQDGLVRNVMMKAAKGTYSRPISKIAVEGTETNEGRNGNSPIAGGNVTLF